MALLQMNWQAFSGRRLIIGLALTLLSGIGPSFAASSDNRLITPDEAALAPAVDDGIPPRGLSDAGPGIEVVRPQEGEIAPNPAEILIRFLSNTVNIDLSSLKVTLLKFSPLNLTDRHKPNVNSDRIAQVQIAEAGFRGTEYMVSYVPR